MLEILIITILADAVVIGALGLLEWVLWKKDHKELKEQTAILEDIAVTLSIKEQKDDPEVK